MIFIRLPDVIDRTARSQRHAKPRSVAAACRAPGIITSVSPAVFDGWFLIAIVSGDPPRAALGMWARKARPFIRPREGSRRRQPAALFLGEERRSCGRRPACPVLHHGHAAYILVESVEKPTDNGPASLLCRRTADADSPETSPALPPAHFPIPLHAPGAAATSTEVPGPRAEGRGRTFVTRPQSPDKGHHEGDRRSRADLLPREPHALEITHGG